MIINRPLVLRDALLCKAPQGVGACTTMDCFVAMLLAMTRLVLQKTEYVTAVPHRMRPV